MQQLLKINENTLYQDFQEKLLNSLDDRLLYDKFRVGCKNEKELDYLSLYYDIFKINECGLSEAIKEKIYGKPCPRKRLCQIKEEYKKEHRCKDEDVSKQCCQISDIGQIEF